MHLRHFALGVRHKAISIKCKVADFTKGPKIRPKLAINPIVLSIRICTFVVHISQILILLSQQRHLSVSPRAFNLPPPPEPHGIGK